ncbi:MAG: galactokinase, partial [Candidatus Rokubacteria bacterium]|nr:galactokinase [Candidatus Rokubacteria bacterium]
MNLIGEHTDYNGGLVLPVALPLRVTVELEPRTDRLVRASSANVDDGRWREVPLGIERSGTWLDHVIGAGRVAGVDRGYDVRISSDIPIGAGLGSSGALGVALLRALREAFGLRIDDVAIATLAQRSENEHVGASSGIMDQMAASLGAEGEALFLDCRSLTFERIPLPGELELVVVHSGITHDHSAGAYNVRRRECEEAARALGVRQLRDAEPADRARIDALPEPLSRRARHV